MTLIPAAQYLRVSTEHQRYSMESQAKTLNSYAECRNFTIVRTYSDSARSGLVLRRRDGLRQLLNDVVQPAIPFRAVLVYDVSRWGRFQDADEAAHYEYICKAAGAPVHYCAEPFDSEHTLANTLIKALKRSMASEYSRELGIKVFNATVININRGYKSGSTAGYGLARLLVDAHGLPKQILNFGERKSLQTEHVALVPGAQNEVDCVRRIYKMFLEDERTVSEIVRILNDEGIPYLAGSKWQDHSVRMILHHPRYKGCLTYGRTTRRLQGPVRRVPKEHWVMADAFAPIISPEFYAKAQARFEALKHEWNSKQELLELLKRCLQEHGKLSERIISQTSYLPCPKTIEKHFGSISAAYNLVGYTEYKTHREIESNKQMNAVRRQIGDQVVSAIPGSRFLRDGKNSKRPRIFLPGGTVLSILTARVFRRLVSGELRWRVIPFRNSSRSWTLLVRMDETNSAPHDYFLLRGLDRSRNFHLGPEHPWMKKAYSVPDFADIPSLMSKMRGERRKSGQNVTAANQRN